jgi:hypothetical protein
MDAINPLDKLTRVAAPPDFEERLMALLAERRRTRPQARRTRIFRYSLAGAAAALLAAFIGLNVFLGPKASPTGWAGASGKDSLRQALPITETMDYRGEVRSASSEPRPVYILENVSYASNSFVKF